jgi:D-aminopeptidase
MNLKKLLLFTLLLYPITSQAQKQRLREHGVEIGILPTGKFNAITDVDGVTVGHKTLVVGDSIRTGVTVILPHRGNIFQDKVPAAIYIGNGFGKLAGYSQVKELGNLETPIILTNTLNVATGINALITYTLQHPENQRVRSVNAVVGETNDGYLNDIRGQHVTENDILEAIKNAKSGAVEEGNVGAGTGTVCFNFKGGIGTSSRVIPEKSGSYTVGVLVQTNFGGVLQIAGIPMMAELEKQTKTNETDGSCMMVVATDAPLDSRNLERLAKRAMLGLARTGGIASNGSGDYVIAFSTATESRIKYTTESLFNESKVLRNDEMTPLFLATIEATEEAILNSLFMAETTVGRDGNTVRALPVEDVMKVLRKYGRVK